MKPGLKEYAKLMSEASDTIRDLQDENMRLREHVARMRDALDLAIAVVRNPQSFNRELLATRWTKALVVLRREESKGFARVPATLGDRLALALRTSNEREN